MPLDLRQLHYFVAVAEHLSFTRAARALDVGQPALSAQVRALERSLGVVLLERSTRRIELTSAGAALLPQARALLADAELTTRSVQNAGQAAVLHLDIVYDGCHTGTEVIRELVQAGYPDTSLQVRHEGGVAAQLDRLRSGALDVGLGRAHELPDDLEHELIRCEPVILGSRSQRYAGPGCASASEMTGQQLTVTDLGGTAPEWVDFMVRRLGAAPEENHTRGMAAAMSMAEPSKQYVTLASLRPLAELSGWTCREVVGWPAYPWSLLWLRSRREDWQVTAVRAAAWAAGSRLGWLDGR